MIRAQRIAMHASLSEPHIDSSTYVCMSVYACMSCNKCRVVQIAYRMFLVHGKNDSIRECSITLYYKFSIMKLLNKLEI